MKIKFINQYIPVLSYWGKIITIVKVCVCFLVLDLKLQHILKY